MVRGEAEEVVLEAEVTNTGALALYRSLGFIRDKHLHRWVCRTVPRARVRRRRWCADGWAAVGGRRCLLPCIR
jgi:hypothetical protein